MKIRNTKDFGLVIRERRRALKLTQGELASRIGVSRQWVVGVERGGPRPDVGLVLRAMRTLRLVVDVRSDSALASDASSEVSAIASVLQRARRAAP